MGGCQSTDGVGLGKSGSVAIGPVPSVLPRREFDDVREAFEFGEEIGRGDVTRLRIVTHKQTKEVFVCKSISKMKISSQDDLHDIKQEVKVFRLVGASTCPQVTRFIRSFEDRQAVHVVAEMCSGGDLFDRILKHKGPFGEFYAARCFRDVVLAVRHCHQMNVVHRDIKPESFAYSDDSPEATLKLNDFSVATFCNPDQELEDLIGTPHYVAPEMLRGTYGRAVDMWSCGVLLYVLLSGYPPFDGKTNEQIFENIVSCPLDFKSQPWPRISPAAKELVRKLLLRDPARRFTPEQVLSHHWFTEQQVDEGPKETPLVLTRLMQFAAYSKFKKEALKVIAGGLPEAEIEGMLNIYHSLDKDGSGNISVAEMRKGLKLAGTRMGQSEVALLMEGVDLDGNREIDYLEFIAATLKDIAIGMSNRDKEHHLQRAFEHFDKDGSGQITADEIMQAMKETGHMDISEEEAQKMLKDVDADQDGKLDYKEFSNMIRNTAVYNSAMSNTRKIRLDINFTHKLRTAPMNDLIEEGEQATETDGLGSLKLRESGGKGSLVDMNASCRGFSEEPRVSGFGSQASTSTRSSAALSSSGIGPDVDLTGPAAKLSQAQAAVELTTVAE